MTVKRKAIEQTTVEEALTASFPEGAMEPVLNRYVEFCFGRGPRENVNGNTPLLDATRSGDTASVAMILKLGTIYNGQKKFSTESATTASGSKYRSTDLAKLVNHKDTSERTALHIVSGASRDCISPIPSLRQQTLQESFFQIGSTKDGRINSKRACYDSIATLLLKHGADYEARERYNLTPLHVAVLTGTPSVVELLIKSGADVNAIGGKSITSEFTPLHAATQTKNEKIIRLLVELGGADIDAKCQEGKTPLHFACDWGHDETVKILLENGADINAGDDFGVTPLHRAAMQNQEDVARVLIENGADVHAQDQKDATPLTFAVFTGSRTVVELLLENGANINVCNQDSGDTALHLAAYFNDKPMAEQLLRYGADVNARNKTGKTPLARTRDHRVSESLIRLLIENGADISIRDNRGKTALLWAVELGYVSVVKFLLDSAGANIHDSDDENNTALHHAAKKGYYQITQVLLNHGADVNSKERNGKTPLQCAREADQDTSYQKLLLKIVH